LAIPEYDDTFFKSNQIVHKKINQKLVEKYIKSFSAISDRVSTQRYYYKYESTCLLIIDFSQNIPKIYNTTQELINDGLLPADTSQVHEPLSWDNFFDKLLNTYSKRFNISNLS
jgi:hypothetical protein